MRRATVQRETRETTVACTLALDGTGQVDVQTGIGFLDHLIATLATHAGFDLQLSCAGDLYVDDHHTAEDTAIVLGQAFDQALGARTDVERFGHALVPLDEALARVAVDLARRPWHEIELGLTREQLGALAAENVGHVLRSFAISAQLCLHVRLLSGTNDHHRAEAAFKGTARALRQAVLPGRAASTKGGL